MLPPNVDNILDFVNEVFVSILYVFLDFIEWIEYPKCERFRQRTQSITLLLNIRHEIWLSWTIFEF